MFVLVAALDYDEAIPPKEKLRKMMQTAGVSITITSLTSFLSFILSGISDIPALSSFAICTAFGVLFDFLN